VALCDWRGLDDERAGSFNSKQRTVQLVVGLFCGLS